MKKLMLILSLFFHINKSVAQNKMNGFYIGLEKICWGKTKNGKCKNSDEVNPKQKWYHENIIKIVDDSVFLDQNPITITNGKKSFSASDGAFMYYSGKIDYVDSIFEIILIERFCDYCGELQEKQLDGSMKRIFRKKNMTGKL